MRAAIYARVSTDDQDCEIQLSNLRDYVRRWGWPAATEYIEKLSGKIELIQVKDWHPGTSLDTDRRPRMGGPRNASPFSPAPSVAHYVNSTPLFPAGKSFRTDWQNPPVAQFQHNG